MGILFFVSLLGYALLLLALLPRLKAGHALFGALSGMLFVSYTGVIVLGWMVSTALVLMYGGLAAFVCCGAMAAANKCRLRERLFTPGMLFYLLAAAAAVAVSRGYLIEDHDSLSYWGRAVRELFVFDRFYIHGDSTMFHMDYIPLLTSLEYSIVRAFGWVDAYVTYVPAACMAVTVAAMTDSMPGRVRPFLFAPLAFYAYKAFGFPVLGIRADGPMLLFFTAGLICLYAREDDRPTSFVPTLAAIAVLTGFKIYSGLMFSALLAIALFVEWLRLRRPRALGWMVLASLVLILWIQLSWSAVHSYHTALAQAQSEAASAAYAGQSVEAVLPSFSLSMLFKGNHRTGELFTSVNAESIRRFLGMAADTIRTFVGSKLKGAPLFALLAAVPVFFAGREKRSRCLRMLVFLCLMWVIYLLGLFASYFVQAETSGAVTNYLSTSSAPFLIVSVFAVLWAAEGRIWRLAAPVLAVMCGLLLFLLPPAQALPSMEPDVYDSFAALAVDYYEAEVSPHLTETDAGKHALLIEASAESASISSRSAKTHAYAYFALPLRVAHPVYYPFGDSSQLASVTQESLYDALLSNRSSLLLLRIEDPQYWDAVRTALALPEDAASIGVYDVQYQDGTFSFSLRH